MEAVRDASGIYRTTGPGEQDENLGSWTRPAHSFVFVPLYNSDVTESVHFLHHLQGQDPASDKHLETRHENSTKTNEGVLDIASEVYRWHAVKREAVLNKIDSRCSTSTRRRFHRRKEDTNRSTRTSRTSPICSGFNPPGHSRQRGSVTASISGTSMIEGEIPWRRRLVTVPGGSFEGEGTAHRLDIIVRVGSDSNV